MIKPYYEIGSGVIYCGNCPDILRQLPDECVQCVVTSPPYWGLRNYGLKPIIWDDHNGCEHEFSATLNPMGNGTGTTFRRDRKAGQKRGGHQPGFCIHCNAWCGSLGLEPTFELYISHIVQIFREVKRVLKKNGTLWLNLGDAYAGSGKGIGSNHGKAVYGDKDIGKIDWNLTQLKSKDLCGIPWRIAFALQNDGWWLRSDIIEKQIWLCPCCGKEMILVRQNCDRDIIWEKTNCMPGSYKDRPTRNFDYIFLLSKSQRYYYDWEAIKEPASPDIHARYARGRSGEHKYANGEPGNQTIAKTFDHMKKPGVNPKARKMPAGWQTGSGSHDKIPKGRYPQPKQNPSFSYAVKDIVEFRNKRSIWTIPTKGFSGPHYATFPEKFVEPCILAGSKKDDIILDPFAGSCTVAVVAAKAGRKFIAIDLSPEYCEMGSKRIKKAIRQRVLFN